MDKKARARFLRTDKGMSYAEISEELGGVAKSTLNYWLRDVTLSAEQRARMTQKCSDSAKAANLVRFGEQRRVRAVLEKERKSRVRGNPSLAARRAGESSRTRSMQQRRDLLDRARARLSGAGVQLTPSSLALVGAALYWAEGRKNGSMSFANSDPAMVALYMRWVREVLGVTEEHLTFVVYAYLDCGLSYEELVSYWCRIAGASPEQFLSPTLSDKKGSTKRRHRLPYGTLHIGTRKSRGYRARYSALLELLGVDGELFVQNPIDARYR